MLRRAAPRGRCLCRTPAPRLARRSGTWQDWSELGARITRDDRVLTAEAADCFGGRVIQGFPTTGDSTKVTFQSWDSRSWQVSPYEVGLVAQREQLARELAAKLDEARALAERIAILEGTDRQGVHAFAGTKQAFKDYVENKMQRVRVVVDTSGAMKTKTLVSRRTPFPGCHASSQVCFRPVSAGWVFDRS